MLWEDEQVETKQTHYGDKGVKIFSWWNCLRMTLKMMTEIIKSMMNKGVVEGPDSSLLT